MRLWTVTYLTMNHYQQDYFKDSVKLCYNEEEVKDEIISLANSHDMLTRDLDFYDYTENFAILNSLTKDTDQVSYIDVTTFEIINN